MIIGNVRNVLVLQRFEFSIFFFSVFTVSSLNRLGSYAMIGSEHGQTLAFVHWKEKATIPSTLLHDQWQACGTSMCVHSARMDVPLPMRIENDWDSTDDWCNQMGMWLAHIDANANIVALYGVLEFIFHSLKLAYYFSSPIRVYMCISPRSNTLILNLAFSAVPTKPNRYLLQSIC